MTKLINCIFIFLLIANISFAQVRKPNIIYIMADDLGYGDLGCYGQTKIKTPEIDRMAAEGMLFTQHYAGATVCMPSRAVLLTGKHRACHRKRKSKLDCNRRSGKFGCI